MYLRTGCLLAIAFTAAAQAGEIPIDLSSLANEPWTYVGPNDFLIINGSTFPTGLQSFGGVPFSIPTGPNNYWAAGAAAGFGPGIVGLTVPVGVYGVTSAFTILNTMWGWAGPPAYVYVTFNGSNGATKTIPLSGNVNVRDYNQDGNTNTVNGTSTVQVWDNGLGQRLDRQQYLLPPEFSRQTLTSITITDTGNEGNGTNGSRAVVAAFTVSTCHAYATETISTSAGAIIYDQTANIDLQRIQLKNVGAAPLAGPLFFILEDLTPGVTVLDESGGSTSCFAPLGSRYIVALPIGSALAPGTTLERWLEFNDPANAAITYTPLVVSGVGGRP